MTWKETNVMDERVSFIGDWLSGDYSKTSLCTAYGVSRPTGDKWIRRYEQEGLEGLKERSRAPHSHPATVTGVIRDKIIETKLSHQAWGPKKVMDWLRRYYPEELWPVDSTAGEILRRAGLVKRRWRVAGTLVPVSHFFNPESAQNYHKADVNQDSGTSASWAADVHIGPGVFITIKSFSFHPSPFGKGARGEGDETPGQTGRSAAHNILPVAISVIRATAEKRLLPPRDSNKQAAACRLPSLSGRGAGAVKQTTAKSRPLTAP